MFFDADTHVSECSDTWSYFPKGMAEFKPVPMVFENDEEPGYTKRIPGAKDRGLFLDGQLFRRQRPSDQLTATTEATRELHDVPARLRDMDDLGVETQVIFPTILLVEVTTRPELEVAVCESYNRWVGDRCSESGGRLQWAALLPLRSMPDALREMSRCKEAGAVGIFKRAFECDERHANDPYFDPMYAQAQELDLPICIHESGPYSGTTQSFSKLRTHLPNSYYVMDAFLSLTKSGTFKRFPRLRFGFIEAGAGWVPHQAWMAGFDSSVPMNRREDDFSTSRERFAEFLTGSRIFITCEASENIPFLLSQMGDDSFMIGSDYTHADRASVHTIHEEIVTRDGLSPSTVRKLTHDNAAHFYGLNQTGLL